MIITFLGHREIYNRSSIHENIRNAILNNITRNEKIYFYCGGYGDFDNMCLEVCHSLKENIIDCEIVYITPYITESHQKQIKQLLDLKVYDSIIYPSLEKVFPRYAISYRNKWMIDQADLVIAYVEHEYGGAYTSLQYAIKHKKSIINLAK